MEQIGNLRKSSAVRRTLPAGRNAPLPEVVYNCALFQRGIFRVSVFLPFLPFLLSRLLVRIELPGDNSGMAFYFDLPLLLTALCVPVAFIGEIKTEPLPLKTDKAIFLYFQRNHVPGFRVEPFYP